MRAIILGFLCLSLMSCKGAENFFDPLPSFLVSGKFTVENNQYIDNDTPSDSGNNSLANPQDIAAPANIAG